MAIEFVVEDGTGLPTATSYLAEADADQYFENRANAAWAAATASAKQVALNKATAYIDIRFSARYKGARFAEDQGLLWPRINVIDNDGFLIGEVVPPAVEDTTAEYAVRALSAELLIDPTFDDTALQVSKKREKVGPIEEETEFRSGQATGLRPYPSADRIMLTSGLLKSIGKNVRA